MAEKKIYLGTVGPFLYDDGALINDEDGDFAGEAYASLTTDGKAYVEEAPSDPKHVLRLEDAGVLVGNVVGPVTGSTDNAVARFDGVTGKLLQDSLVLISDAGKISTPSVIKFGAAAVPIFADNAAAVAGGLAAGDIYRKGTDPDWLCIVH